ncbi:MAG TPA: FdhF/YdeP family oxidoreductase [Pyrinomonadaceae bacterium]|nr:FdhF/YdeP family oxidoreductase [Pyrinomonadaceae bacterium]
MNSSDKNLKNLKVGEVKNTAAGISSILSTTKELLKKSGAVRGTKLMLAVNQKGGIDCNSCAWADPEGERTHAEFCENGAKAIADEADTRRVTPAFFAKHSVEELSEKSDRWLNSQGRITEPVFLEVGATHYQSITWEKAFHILAEELNALDSPNAAVFYTSGRTSNEAAFLYQLFVRQFGTNNLPDCSNMCHESTSVALLEAIGLGKATIRLEDLENTDLIIIIGQNPGTNAPRMLSSLQKAKEKGAKIIAVNPLPEAGLLNFVNPNPEQYKNYAEYALKILKNEPTHLADIHLPIRIGGDMAFLKGVMKILVEHEKKSPKPIFDYEFINAKTENYQDLITVLESTAWEDIFEQSGLSLEQITQVAEIYLQSNRVITCWAMGVTQHKQAVATVQDIANLHFLRGQIGRQGAGLCPVRGHSNVQGDRSMGIWEKMNPKFRENLEKEFQFKTPQKDGFDTVESIKAMHDGRAGVFFAIGGNFVSATPDTEFTSEALRKCNLTAQVITKLNRTALVTGKKSLILPCLGRTEIDRTGGKEQFVSTESTMLNVQMSKGILEPASEHLRSETWIVGKLARAVLKNKTTVDWEKFLSDYDTIRKSISHVVPGCENYNQKIRQDGGFYMPNPPREGIFPTDTGKAKFVSEPMEKITLEKDELLMTTIRAHDQFNTTIYTDNDRYRGIKGSRRVILMNEKDINQRNLKQGEVVDITSVFNGKTRRAESFIVVKYPIPKDCAATYFPEANALVPIESVAEKSNCPTSKFVKITIAPHLHNGEKTFAGKFNG